MKGMSAAMMKRTRRCGRQNLEPKNGSLARKIFDVLMAHKGEVVDLSDYLRDCRQPQTTMQRLRDDYELDIRNFHFKRYSLVGEWVGTVYIDYLAERRKDADYGQSHEG